MARNIYLSLIWPVADAGRALEGFSLVTALAVVAGLRQAGIGGADRLQVKWPNDVWLDAAKLAGILLELHGAQAGPCHVVVGIGVNVQLTEEERQAIGQPVSDLHAYGNQQLDRNDLVVAILHQLEENLAALQQRGFGEFREQWQALDIFHRRLVELDDGRQRIRGRVMGVSNSGALILATDGGERQFTGGELAPSLRPAQGIDRS
jgi:BirA family biotin operon repressor/biotin-[acetyl-CoA-carboxylase] ligase